MHDCDSLVGPWKREVGASSRYLDLVDLFVVDVLVIDAQEDLPLMADHTKVQTFRKYYVESI